MNRKTVIKVVRSCGLGLAITASLVGLFSPDYLPGYSPQSTWLLNLSVYGTAFFVLVGIRLLVFGLRVRTRLKMAPLISVLITMTITICAYVYYSLTSRHPNDAGMLLVIGIVFITVPYAFGSIILAAIPIFDGRYSKR